MSATGNEAVKLSQLKTYKGTVDTALDEKLASPSSEGTSGQILSWNGEATEWIDAPEGGTEYTGTAPIQVSGNAISVREAGDGTSGVVSFASDEDFTTYMAD